MVALIWAVAFVLIITLSPAKPVTRYDLIAKYELQSDQAWRQYNEAEQALKQLRAQQ